MSSTRATPSTTSVERPAGRTARSATVSIVANGVNGALMQYNVVYDTGGNTTTCGGPCGLWAYSANDVTIQFNEVYGMGPAGTPPSGACDWNGYDLDGLVTKSTLQYNYAHDNFGSGYLAYISGAWSGNTIRYNIGQNDGSEVALAGYQATTGDLAVYDNTLFDKSSTQSLFQVGVSGGGTIAGHVANNVFYSSGGGELVNVLSWNTASVTGVSFLRNDYYATGAFGITWNGTAYSSLGAWASATGQETQNGTVVGASVDPRLQNPGSGGTVGGYQPAALSGYLLQPSSSLVATGIDLKKLAGIDMGSQDYFGNAIPNGSGTGYDVGADGTK
jgi:hypothetical protein